MKVIKCKNVTQYLELEKRACEHLNIPNKHHERYAPPPNDGHLDFPITDMVKSLFDDQQVVDITPVVDDKTLRRRRRKKKLKKKIWRP